MSEPVRRFRKRSEVRIRKPRPYNAETPPGLLRRSFVTPRESFYVRNHGDVPEVNPEAYRLEVCGLVERPLGLSLEEIREAFPRVESAATLYCAGNRREELMARSPMPGKVAWQVGAAGNAVWGGVRLRDVLREAGVGDGVCHVAFTGLDTDIESGTGTRFGGSIPVGWALSDGVMLAYEMNGAPLAPEHGFPLRVVAGGYIGARSVKWLSAISLQREPSDNHYQAVEYKLFPPHVTAETADPSRGEMLGEIPLNAVICTPEAGATLRGPVTVRGYAIAGGERRVERVELSPDGGASWTEARLDDGDDPCSWRFWEAGLELEAGPHRLLARATDSAGGTQPEDVNEVWNFQGYVNNAWHGVDVTVE